MDELPRDRGHPASVVLGRGQITRRRRLTPRGRALIRKIFPGHVEAIVEEFEVLTAAEQAELGRLCKKVGLRQGR